VEQLETRMAVFGQKDEAGLEGDLDERDARMIPFGAPGPDDSALCLDN
jgi:hypothetical protein